MLSVVRRHLVVFSLSTVVVLGAAAWLAFGYFGVHTLFIDNEVDEALPTFAATAEPVVTAPQPTADTAADQRPQDDAPVATGPASTETPESDDAASSVVQPLITTDAIGMFGSLGRYRTVGTAVVLGDGSGQRFLRFEEFETSNGPDLNVYLVNSSTGDVTDFVDLGNLRGNIGSQNYEIPAEVDLAVYDTVMIWCVRFSTGFGEALLELT
jgi:hypothetical protein